MNLFLFIAICFVAYILFRNFEYNSAYGIIEGMTDGSGNITPSSTNGVAGNAASYGATIKAVNIKCKTPF